MARRRGQLRGHVHRQGNAWYLAYREDALGEDGALVRLRRNRRIADAKEVTKREATRIAREFLGELDAQAQRPLSLLTVEQFVEARFKPDVVWSLKEAGRRHYQHMLDRQILPALGGLALREVTSDHVQELVKRKIEQGYAVQTARHIKNAVSAVFKHAKLKRAYLGDNPASGVRLPEMTRREPHALSFEQARMLLARLASPAREMALLSMLTSLNVAEMLALRWKRINLSAEPMVMGGELLLAHSLAVRENYYRGTFGSVKAASRRRVVPLTPAVLEALRLHYQQTNFTDPEDLIFSTANGKPQNERNLLRRQLKPVGAALGMPWLSWHVFRRTHATFGEQIGMALSDRQAQMGHSDPWMTMQYTHSDLARRRDSLASIEARLIGSQAA